jgi:hypothetical protein
LNTHPKVSITPRQGSKVAHKEAREAITSPRHREAKTGKNTHKKADEINI